MTQLSVVPNEKAGDIQRQIEEAFKLLQQNRWKMANTTAAQRIAMLERLKETILRRKDELAAAMWADFHKPATEVEITELQPVVAELSHYIKHLKGWMKPQKVRTPMHLFGTKSYVKYEPKGVILVMSPWNYPFNLLFVPLIAAISAGNTVMMRPSDKVQKTSTLMKSIIEEVFTRDQVAIFVGPSSIANIMLELKFDHIFFTGSTAIGKQVMAKAAQHLASVTLELGGQSPVVVDETADIAASAQRLVWGKFINAGQTCIAPNHIFVHETKVPQFITEVKRNIGVAYGASDDARKSTGDFARVVDTRSHKRLTEMVEKSVAAGAKLEAGGQQDATERYLAPTVLSNVKPDQQVMSEEIFGPIMPIIAYKNLDEVIKHIQSGGKPLAMYIFSENKHHIDYLLNNTTAGGTVINNCLMHFANDGLPFGGTGESGLGNYHGYYGFKTCSHERAVMVQGKPAAAKMFYPPYTDKMKKLVGFLTNYLAR